jgi:hypothetical protein
MTASIETSIRSTMSTMGPLMPVQLLAGEVRGHLLAALVQQHDDGLDVAPLQLAGVAVGRLGLVEEAQPADALGADDPGGVLQGHADEADPDALHLLDDVRRQQGPPGLRDHVGGEVREVGALVGVSGLAAVDRVAPAPLDAQQLVGPLVELVVADGRDVELDGVERFDGRLVVEERRDQRRRADEVARRDGQAVGLLRAQGSEVPGEVGHAAGRRAVDRAAGAGGRLEVAVEVVDRQQLQVDDLALDLRLALRAGCSGRPGGRAGDERRPGGQRGQPVQGAAAECGQEGAPSATSGAPSSPVR